MVHTHAHGRTPHLMTAIVTNLDLRRLFPFRKIFHVNKHSPNLNTEAAIIDDTLSKTSLTTKTKQVTQMYFDTQFETDAIAI